MASFSAQSPRGVVMVRPHHFTPNDETVADNAFQISDRTRGKEAIRQAAYHESTKAAEALEAAGVTVHLFEDLEEGRPDSVFPNNWFSTHAGGHVAIYPMACQNRRAERRWDIIEFLKSRYRVQNVIDYSGLEHDGIYLEGTGAMVLDHIGRVAYAAQSNRAHEVALERFCTDFNFEPMLFDASDSDGRAIYHTNVMMCVGTEFCLIGLDTIVSHARRAEVRERLESQGRAVIALSNQQIAHFAGNALELQAGGNRILAVSSRAIGALRRNQISQIERLVQPITLDIPTIELAGGSVRCMLAGIHLAPR